MNDTRTYGKGSKPQSYTTPEGKRWYTRISYVDKQNVRRQKRLTGFATEAAARKGAMAAIVDLQRGVNREPSALTLADYVRGEYLPWVKANLQPVTHANYTATLERWVLPVIGDVPLQKVTRHDVQAVLDSLTGKASATVDLCLTLLGAALQMAVDDDLISGNPAKHRRLRKPADRPNAKATGTRPSRIPWSADEAKVFLASLQPDKEPMDLAFLLAALTGMRRGELAGLRWGDVNLDDGLVTIARSVASANGELYAHEGGKTANAARTIGLVPRVNELLTRHKMREAERFWANGRTFGDESPVFATWLCGPFAPHTFTTRFTAAVKRSGVTPKCLHSLRHLAISQAQANAVVSQGLVGKVVGHSSVKVTDVYTHAEAETAHLVAESIASRLLEVAS